MSSLSFTKLLRSSKYFGIGLFTMLLFVSAANGQSTANYVFSTNTTSSLATDLNANLVDMSTGTTQLVGAGLDAAASTVQNIGFNFTFMGRIFDRFAVQEDGIIQLGGTAPRTNTYTITGGTATAPRLSPLCADFRTGTSTGKIHHKVIGTAPNRVLVIEFTDMQLFYTAAAAAGSATWQARLYENGTIEYVYGGINVVNISSGNKSPSIGFYTGAASGQFASVNYDTHTSSTTAPYAANAAVAATGALTQLNSASNGSRRAYQFTPAVVPVTAPSNISFTNVGKTNMTVSWTDNSTGELGYAVFISSNAGVSYALAASLAPNVTTVDLTGLTPGVTYLVDIVAIDLGTTSTPLSGSQQTVPPGDVYTTAIGGLASSASTWVGGIIPIPQDSIIIASGATLILDVASTAGRLSLEPGASAYAGANFTCNTDINIAAGASLYGYYGTTGRQLTVLGNINNEGTIYMGMPGASFVFSGTNTQSISGNGTFSGIVPALTLNNANGLVITPNLTIGQTLTLTRGNISGTSTITLGNAAFSSAFSFSSSGGRINLTTPVASGFSGLSTITYTYNASTPVATYTTGNELSITAPNLNVTFGAAAGGNYQLGTDISVNNLTANDTIDVNGFNLTHAGALTFGNANINITGSGTYTMGSNATITSINTAGLSASALTGHIRTSIRNYSNTGNYTFNVATGATGDGLPTTLIGGTVTISNTTTLTQSTTFFNLTLSNTLTTGANSVIIEGTGNFGTNTISGTGSFTSGANSRLLLNNTNANGVIQSSGAAGNILVTGGIVISNGTDLVIGGAAVGLGNGFPSTGIDTLVLNQTTQVTLAQPISVNTLVISNTGRLTTSNTNTLTVLGTATGSISRTSTGYIDGPLTRVIPAGSSGSYLFPIASGVITNATMLELVNPNVSGGSITVTALVRNSTSGGTQGAGFTGTLNTNRHWVIYPLTGPGTLNSVGAIRVYENSLANAGLGRKLGITVGASRTGTYNYLGGLMDSTSIAITSSLSIPTLATGTDSTFLALGPGTSSGSLAGGTYVIGPGGNYNSLSGAIAALSEFASFTGPIILEFNASYSTAVENYPIVFSRTLPTTSISTLTIRPSASVTLPINFTTSTFVAGTPVFDFNRTQHITIDGRPGGVGSDRFITITQNNNVSTGNPALRFINDAQNITLRRLVVTASNPSATSGVIFFSTAGGSTVSNGNNNNLIDFCNINGNAASMNGIFSLGSASPAQNKNNTITNCNIYDFFINGASAGSNGILISTNNLGWTIGTTGNGNNFYQTAARTTTSIPALTSATTFRAIQINNTGGGYSIIDNRIGGNIPGIAGSTFTIGDNTIGTSVAHSVRPIDISAVDTTIATSIQGNIIQNFTIYASSTSSFDAFVGIGVFNNSAVNIGNVSPNIIGSSTSNSSINIFQRGTSTAVVQGIRYNGAGGVNNGSLFVQNNQIGGFSLEVTGSQASAGSIVFTGIVATATYRSPVIISSNLIGSTTTVDNIYGSPASIGGISITGINPNGATGATITVNSNTITNITNAFTGTTGTPLVRGILANGSSANPITISNNTITNLTCSASVTAVNENASVSGISAITSGAGSVSIRNNTIHSLQNSFNLYAATCVNGLLYNSSSTATNNTIESNNIHSLFANNNNALAVVNGILHAGGTNRVVVSNNMIRIGIAPSGSSVTGTHALFGISKTGGLSTVVFNTVYIGGAGVSNGTVNTFAFSRTIAGSVDSLFNNVFVNARSNASGGGKHYAVRLSNNTTLLANNNLYFANGTGGLVGLFNTTDQPSINNWKITSAVDANSFSANPQLINPTGTASTVDLHISTSIATPVEATGINLSNVTSDFDGQTRSTLTPTDLGADAGNFIASDVVGPIISYQALNGTISSGSRILTASISDVTGIPTIGAQRPRVYYKKLTAGSFVSSIGNLVSGNGVSGVWNFTIDPANVGGVTVGDTIYYFIAAEDSTALANLSTNPLGGSGTDVANITVAPTNLDFYPILSGVSGNFLVGASQVSPNFVTITEAINSIKQKILAGNVNLLLQADYNSALEAAFPIELPPVETESNAYRIVIRPDAGVTDSITGSSTSSILHIRGGDRYVIDGSNNGTTSRNLSIHNSNVSAGTAAIWISSISANQGSVSNTIQNLNLSCNAVQTTSTNNTFGIFVGGSSIALNTGGNDNDSNQFINNFIYKVRYGLYMAGGSVLNPNLGTTITGNTFGPALFDTTIIGKAGILLREVEGVVIAKNEIRNIGITAPLSAAGSDRAGIALATDAAWPSPTTVYAKNVRILQNKIHDIFEEKTFSACGIISASVDGSNNTNIVIANNDIYAVRSNGTGGDQTAGIGVQTGRGDSILFNTINFTGDLDPGSSTATSTSSGGLIIASTSVVNPVLRNNIISVDFTSNTTTLRHADIIVPASYSWGTGSSNANLLYANPANSQIVIGITGTTNNTLISDWRTASSQDAASVSANPRFNSPSVSVLYPLSPAVNSGVAISGYTTDILDITRSATPTIGAYEQVNDLIAPTISYTLLNNTSSTTSRIVNNFATVIDTSTINVTAGSAPRIYFKKKTEDNVFGANNNIVSGWKWVEATNTTSPFSFNINFGLLNSTPAVNDTIQYFVVAQDVFNNVAALPLAGFAGTSVGSITSAPSTPNFFKIVDQPLAGPYNVGASGSFSNITNAIGQLTERGVSGPVTFFLTDLVYSVATTTEVFPIVINNPSGVNATNTVTITPAPGVTTQVIDSIPGPLFDLSGANYINFDGRQAMSTNPKSLTISNKHVSASACAVRLINDASNNRLEYAQFLGVNSATSGAGGVIVFGSGIATGNDKNVIAHNDIGNAITAASTPVYPTSLIWSAGSTTNTIIYNDSNTVVNNYLFNFWNPTAEANALKISNGNNAWTITDNHIYQTIAKTTTALHYGMNFQNSSNRLALNNMVIERNFIGGSAPFCGGSPWTQSSSAGRFSNFFNMGNVGSPSVLRYNKISNISYTTTSTTATIFNLIQMDGGLLTIDSNIFGAESGKDSIIITGPNISTVNNLITLNSGENVQHSFRGNVIGAITVTGGGANSLSYNLLNIAAATGTYQVIGNKFGNGESDNIVINSSTSATAQSITCINSTSAAGKNIRFNTFQNVRNNYAGTTGTPGSLLIGVNLTGGVDSVTNNVFANLSSTSPVELNSNTSASISGIVLNASTSLNLVADNQIYGLVNTHPGTGAVTVNGIVIGAASNSLVTRNLIHSLVTSKTDAAANINGIHCVGGTLNRITNNMIRLGIDSTGADITSAANINGIFRAGSSGSVSVLFNSVYVGGNNVGTPTARTFALQRTFSGTDSIVNNILMNVRTNASATGGGHFAIGLNNSTTLVADYNLLFVGSGNGDTLGRFGTTAFTNLPNFKNASLSNANSISANPNYISPAGSNSSIDLHISGTTPIESTGLNIPNILTDYDNQLRNSLSPTDIGADAGNFTTSDISGPSISFTSFIRDTVSAQRTVADIIITDLSGISNINLPRLYYKKKNDDNVFGGNTSTDNGWKYVIANNASSPYSFTINYGIINGGSVAIGDTIQYFIVAEDINGFVSANPLFGFDGTVTSVTTAPTTPLFYPIRSNPLRGLYQVGSGLSSPNFATLTQALNTLDTVGVSGPVTLELVDADYSTNEVFPLRINTVLGSSSLNTVTIKPAVGVSSIVSGLSASAILILNGADFIDIQGSNNNTTSRNLTFANTSTSGTAAVIWAQTTTALDPVTNNTIRNVVVNGNSSTTTGFGIGFGSTTISNTSTGRGNNNNTIQNCSVNAVINGIYMGGNSLSLKDESNRILQNIMISSTPNCVRRAITVSFQNNMLIDGNTLANMQDGASVIGISLGYTGTNTFVPTGSEVTNTVVRNNKIGPMQATGGTSALGIVVVPATSGVDSIYNNMIFDLRAASTPSDFIAGIYVGGGTGSATRIFHNSVSLTGSVTTTTPNRYALAIGSGNPIVEVRNNILANTQSTSGTGKNFAIGLGSTTFSNYVSDYNIYFVSGPLGQLAVSGGIGVVGTGTEYSTLAALRTAVGNDANSSVKEVDFVSTTDLHLAGPSIGNGAFIGAPISTITTDIDGEPRFNPPYIGADENVGAPLPVELTLFKATAKGRNVILDWTTASEINNRGFEVERSLDGRSFAKIRFVAGAGNSVQTNNYQYTDANAFALQNVLYYRLRQLDRNGKFAYSDIVTVTSTSVAENALMITPNPFTSEINAVVNAKKDGIATINIVDLQGRIVVSAQEQVVEGPNTLQLNKLENLQTGVYFIRISTADEVIVTKVVKQ